MHADLLSSYYLAQKVSNVRMMAESAQWLSIGLIRCMEEM